MENGSGGFMSDLTFYGGKFGMYSGNQHFTTMRLKFRDIETAIQVHWDWGWTWKSLDISGSVIAMSLISPGWQTGSVLVMDSKITNSQTAFVMGVAPQTPTSEARCMSLSITSILKVCPSQ